jgi:hypothetical protein
MWPRRSHVRPIGGAEHCASGQTNNCYRDYAQTNARQLADLLADVD